MNCVVVHYHEVALKRGNRRNFVRQLVAHLRMVLRGTGVKRVRTAAGCVVLILNPEANWREISQRLQWVFGVANFSLARRTAPTVEAISAAAVAAIQGRSFATFAVQAKRTDKTFPVASPEIGRLVGAAIVARTEARVDLDRPELAVVVKVMPGEAFVSIDRLPGPGGLPVGSGGAVLALLSGGIDSPVAAWRVMRRGCAAEFVHFHGAPYQDRSSLDKVVELVRLLTRYQVQSRLHVVTFGGIQGQIVTAVRRPVRVVLYRRMMLRIAAALARTVGAAALVTGESLGQVASQTLANVATIDAVADLPVLRPLIAMDKAEIRAEAERIGTYEISIQPDQDCCQLFVPRHPATRLTVTEAAAAESALDVAALLREGLANVRVEEFAFPEMGNPHPGPISALRRPTH